VRSCILRQPDYSFVLFCGIVSATTVQPKRSQDLIKPFWEAQQCVFLRETVRATTARLWVRSKRPRSRCTRRPEHRAERHLQGSKASTVLLSHRIIGGMLCYRCTLTEVKDCWHGWGVVVRLYRLQTMCFWWRMMDLVSPQCMGNTIDLWLRDVWMICNLWHGYDGAGTAGFAPLRVHSAFRSDLVQRDRLRTPRSRCGAKGVVRHTSLLASVLADRSQAEVRRRKRVCDRANPSPINPEHRDVAHARSRCPYYKTIQPPSASGRIGFFAVYHKSDIARLSCANTNLVS